MKGTKSDQGQVKRSAEDWVSVARHFGEECVKIQQNSKLSIDQKLDKQRALADKMAKEIQQDPHLKEEDKRQMINSINNYMAEWKSMYDIIQQGSTSESSPKKKK